MHGLARIIVTLALSLSFVQSLAPIGVRAQPLPRVTLGDDLFMRDTWRELHGRCIGIVTNQSGVLSNGESFIDAVRANPQICVKALFAPEHGLRGDRTAGAYVDSYIDAKSNLPVYSLYGKTRHPSAAMLAGIDVLVFDIQDVGARTYTYISTMAYVMESAQQFGKPIWVLDRPNPVDGVHVEGPVLEPKFASFVGLYPLPERHGLTIGELARLFNDRFHIGADLRVIAMRGWTRDMHWSDTGLRWIATSPNVPYALTPLLLLCTGLVSEAGVNNGVGTDRPFEYAGGYGFDARAFAASLAKRPIPGAHVEPMSWVPDRGFWAGKTLSGVYIHIDDQHAFPSVRTALDILIAARAQGKFVVPDAAIMDRDWGTDAVRRALVAGASAETIAASWEPDLAAFRAMRGKYLLY